HLCRNVISDSSRVVTVTDGEHHVVSVHYVKNCGSVSNRVVCRECTTKRGNSNKLSRTIKSSGRSSGLCSPKRVDKAEVNYCADLLISHNYITGPCCGIPGGICSGGISCCCCAPPAISASICCV